MAADFIDCFHRSLDFLFSISLISFQHHVQLRRKCSYWSTHWQWEDYLCGVCSTATSSANTWLQMCLCNSIAVSCWPGKCLERKLAWTVHPSVVTCAPCVHSAFVVYVFCYKINLISCFDNYLFPHYLHKFPVFPRFVAVFCFSCALSGCLVFRAWLRLSSFPSLGFGCLLFPRLALVVFFSLAWFRLSSFPSLGFGCLLFPRLASVVFFSLAWLWLSSFPALCYVILVFPRLAPVALFSRAWLGFLVFPRLVCLLVFPHLSPNELFFPRLAPVALFFPRV